MYKIFVTILTFLVCFLPAAAFAAAPEEASSNTLIDKAKDYDGHTVSYSGEVIGDIMKRGEYAWINVSDGNNAVGIWIKSGILENVTIAGRYGNHGDTVKVEGVFHRACPDHGGDFDIHADKIEVAQKGYETPHRFSPLKAIIAFILSAAALICVFFAVKRYKKA